MLYSNAPRDTAAYWLKGRPLAVHYDRSSAPVSAAAKALEQSGWFNSHSDPMLEAVHFYLLNHATVEIATRFDPLEPITDLKQLSLLQTYDATGSEIARRLFFYVLLITTREARHNKTSAQDSTAKVTPIVQAEYPMITKAKVEEMVAFTKSFPDSSAALGKMLDPLTKDLPLGPFCKMLSGLYYKCSWSSAYGGPKWGNIADALFAFVRGTWSAEMFADTAFTLAHNTAPIFNKGMLYNNPGQGVIELLDCQRAGMVPQWLADTQNYSHDKIVQQVRGTLPHMFEGSVDWEQVMALGAVGNYKHKVPAKPPEPIKPPTGCTDKQIAIDHKTTAWVLDYKRKAAA